jgi:hypothetical protein
MSGVSTRQTPHRRLNTLWEEVINKPDVSLLTEVHVTDAALETYQVERIHCDFEGLRDEHINPSLSAPILFEPLHSDILQDHRIDLNAIGSAEEQAEEMAFRAYDPPMDPEELRRGYWSAKDCAGEVFQYLYALIRYFPRIDVPFSLLEFRNIKSVQLVSIPQ